MKYSHFDDITMLLIELCKPMNDDEITALMNVKIAMSEDKDFDISYTSAVKGLYVKNFQAMQNKTYQPQQFSEMNQKLLQGIKNKTASVGLLPSYLRADKNKKEIVAGLKAKIIKLKSK